MAYPSQSTIRSYGGACPPSYLAGTLASSYTAGQTFTLGSGAGWYEVSSTGQATSNPLGTSGPFVVTLDFSTSTEEKVLCSAINVSTGVVTVWTDGTLNGRGYDGTTISAHVVGATPNCFPVASAVENLQLNAGVVSALSSLSSKVASVTAGDSSITIAGTATAPTVAVASSGASVGSYGNGYTIPTFTVDAKGRITSNSSVRFLTTVAPISTAQTLIAGNLYLCDTSAGAFTVTLPAGLGGQFIAVQLKTGANAVTINAGTGQTINNTLSSIQLTSPGQSVYMTHYQTGTTWEVIGASSIPASATGFAVPTGGDLTGSYPAPTLAAVGTAGMTGSASSVPVITTDSKGRVTTATDTSIQITESQVTDLTTDLGNKVPTSRTISTTAPLAGGGDLTADRTLSIADATTAVKGAVQLTNSTSSTSTTTAATPNSVKTAYDLANAALPLAGGTMNFGAGLNMNSGRVLVLGSPGSTGDATRAGDFNQTVAPFNHYNAFGTHLAAWTFDPLMANVTSNYTSNVFNFTAIYIPFSVTVSGVATIIGTAGSGLTASGSNIGLFNATTCLAQTGTTTATSMFGGTGIQTGGFVAPVTVSAGVYWIGHYVQYSTSSPVLVRSSSQSAAIQNLFTYPTAGSLTNLRTATYGTTGSSTFPATGSALPTGTTPTVSDRHTFWALYI